MIGTVVKYQEQLYTFQYQARFYSNLRQFFFIKSNGNRILSRSIDQISSIAAKELQNSNAYWILFGFKERERKKKERKKNTISTKVRAKWISRGVNFLTAT